VDKKNNQIIQKIHNPFTGKMMKAKTFSGKELFWKEVPFEEENIKENEKELPPQ
jgi:hypothetical protein